MPVSGSGCASTLGCWKGAVITALGPVLPGWCTPVSGPGVGSAFLVRLRGAQLMVADGPIFIVAAASSTWMPCWRVSSALFSVRSNAIDVAGPAGRGMMACVAMVGPGASQLFRARQLVLLGLRPPRLRDLDALGRRVCRHVAGAQPFRPRQLDAPAERAHGPAGPRPVRLVCGGPGPRRGIAQVDLGPHAGARGLRLGPERVGEVPVGTRVRLGLRPGRACPEAMARRRRLVRLLVPGPATRLVARRPRGVVLRARLLGAERERRGVAVRLRDPPSGRSPIGRFDLATWARSPCGRRQT